MKNIRPLLLIALAPLTFAACAVEPSDDADDARESALELSTAAAPATKELILKQIASLEQAAATIREQASKSMGDGLTAEQQKNYALQTTLLCSIADRLGELAGNFGDTPGLNGGDMMQKMAAMNMQFLALQEATQKNLRKFQTLSNASKARHDIALNAIRNMKA
jgi:flagellar biosynthesis chaperone FliJ